MTEQCNCLPSSVLKGYQKQPENDCLQLEYTGTAHELEK